MTNKQLRRKIEETLAGLVVVRTVDGLKVRRKRGPKREQVLNAPEFEGSRGSLGDFVAASRSAKLLRNSLRESLLKVDDRGMYNRLTSTVCKVLKADLRHAAGSRRISDGEPGLLKQFEFNAKSALGTTLLAPHRTTINKLTGEVVVDVASFNASKLVYAAPGATHFILHASASTVDFDNMRYHNAYQESALIPVDAMTTGNIQFNMQLPAGSSLPTFVAFGIYFVQQMHGVTYPLMNNSYNALLLTAVDNEKVVKDAPATEIKEVALQPPTKPGLKTFLGPVNRLAGRMISRRDRTGDG
ncbi:hypothetical protein [uncultured Chitinophaga sp.]|uniref:hypothetical protein n=1 Tax=uncultured Chitinophaga sp. TaxID=339340 RepID=UPI0025DB77C0|nr:hypothetical protein [uncultured Chitinophaga sp.]